MKKRPHLLLVLAFCGCLAAVANTAPGKHPEQLKTVVWDIAPCTLTSNTQPLSADDLICTTHLPEMASCSSLPTLPVAHPTTQHLASFHPASHHPSFPSCFTAAWKGLTYLHLITQLPP